MALLLVAAGCNEKKKSSARIAPPICGGNSFKCLPRMVDWKVDVRLADFPQNIRLNIAGFTMLDECSGDSSGFEVIRQDAVSIESRGTFKPRNKIKFEIFDLGSNCLEMNSYYSAEEQGFNFEEGVVKITLE